MLFVPCQDFKLLDLRLVVGLEPFPNGFPHYVSAVVIANKCGAQLSFHLDAQTIGASATFAAKRERLS